MLIRFHNSILDTLFLIIISTVPTHMTVACYNLYVILKSQPHHQQ
uniref:Uncharacterized protein n=1 Tax=Anguilla anguilla TaxID=7936 RepID=A0A0E9XCJ5_ANGAN